MRARRRRRERRVMREEMAKKEAPAKKSESWRRERGEARRLRGVGWGGDDGAEGEGSEVDISGMYMLWL